MRWWRYLLTWKLCTNLFLFYNSQIFTDSAKLVKCKCIQDGQKSLDNSKKNYEDRFISFIYHLHHGLINWYLIVNWDESNGICHHGRIDNTYEVKGVKHIYIHTERKRRIDIFLLLNLGGEVLFTQNVSKWVIATISSNYNAVEREI